MGTPAPPRLALDAAAVHNLIKTLRTETSPPVLVKHLDDLIDACLDDATGDVTAVTFLRADGLLTLIRFLRGTAPM
jgi:hypothetical protein